MNAQSCSAVMSARTFTLWRCNCGLHAYNRAAEQGIPISYQEIENLNAWIERMKPAFEIAGRTRYRVNVHRGNGQRIRVIYDTALATVVTVMAKRRANSSLISTGTGGPNTGALPDVATPNDPSSHLGLTCQPSRHNWMTTEHGHDICLECKLTRPTPSDNSEGENHE